MCKAFFGWLNEQSLDKGVIYRPPIEIQPRLWFNPEIESRNFLVPGPWLLLWLSSELC